MASKYLVYADLETASECDLRGAGVYKYAEHPSTRVQMFSYMLRGESKASLWVPEEGQRMPKDLKEFIRDPECIFMFHNAQFDRILLHTLSIVLPVQRFRCMMIQAMSHSLPGGLEALGTVLKIDEDKAKIKDGKRLVLMFCKPQKNAKTGELTWRTYETNPEDWEQYKEYCRRDTEVMPLIHSKLPAFNYPKRPELDYWFLDQDLNDRGMPVDLELVDAAQRAIDDTRVRLNKQTVELTEGEVQAATQRDALMDYLKETYGMDIDDMKKSTVERLLDDPETDPAIRELLILRRASTTSSTAKYKKMRTVACSDGRIRGAIQFNGAKRTARDAGRMVQPQNFPSRGLLKYKEVMIGIKALKHDMAYDLGFDVMHLASSALRYTIAAPKGKKFVIADLSAIEGRGLAWVADEKWKVQAYQESDADPKAPDLYMLSYAKSFNVPPSTVTKDQRQIGKVLELACLGPDTKVLTEKRGFVPIVNVTTSDRVWDGCNWVRHSGLVDRGERWTIELNGIRVTEDHLITIGPTWKQAQQLATNRFMNGLALATGLANLPLSNLPSVKLEECPSSKCNALAEKSRILLNGLMSGLVKPHAVISVLRKRQKPTLKNTVNTQTLLKTWRLEGDSLIEYPLLLQDATTVTQSSIGITVAEEYMFAMSGEKVEGLSWNMSKPLKDSTTRILKWIESTMTKVMSLETSGLFLKAKIARIKDLFTKCKNRSTSLKQKMRVYDLSYCGPKNRFMILSSKGPMLVHNCGYGGGVGAFVNFASAFKIDLEALSDKLVSVLPDDVFNEAQGFYDWAVSRELKTFGLSKTAFSAIDATKRLWRSGHPATCKFWADVEDSIRQALMFGKPGEPYPFGIDGFAAEKYRNWILVHMPSGRRLCYPGMQMTDNGKRLVFQGENQFTKQWSLIPTGGPKCTENIVQAISRDIFKHGQKLADEAGYKTILVVHDELVCEVPDSDEFTVSALEGFMTQQPPWAKSLPLAAKGFETYRYHKED